MRRRPSGLFNSGGSELCSAGPIKCYNSGNTPGSAFVVISCYCSSYWRKKIIGGLFFGLSRKASTEFSFFLAIPTLFAASAYQLYKERALLSMDDIGMWAVGFIAAFASAFLCVRWLLRYIATHDFTIFAWYRIAFGLVVLATAWSGAVNWTA